jgi:hypothetical protein
MTTDVKCSVCKVPGIPSAAAPAAARAPAGMRYLYPSAAGDALCSPCVAWDYNVRTAIGCRRAIEADPR